MVRFRIRKDHKTASSSPSSSFRGLSPWFAVLLGLVALGMNYQTSLQMEAAEMAEGIRRMSLLENNNMNHVYEVPKNATAFLNQQKKKKPRLLMPIPPRQPGIVKELVKNGDYIYFNNQHARWDSAPIVLKSHKLLFFTIPKVGCTVWKQLFRRMMGYDDWNSQDDGLPHNPGNNGLKYLYHYSLEEASEMMTSPEWTRAIMVRDPKMRFLSAFLDKSVSNDHKHIIQRCCPDKSCVDEAQTIPGFLRLVQLCDDAHWRRQHERVEFKYWPFMNFVLHVETASQDARKLLEKIGAWDEFGKTGWGKDGTLPIFGSTDSSAAGEHATWSQWKVWQWYNNESEKLVEEHYQSDYMNPLFGFERGTCLTCV